MQELPSRSAMAPANLWSYARSSFPEFKPLQQQYRDARFGQPATLEQEISKVPQNTYPLDESDTCENALFTEPLSTQQDEVSIPMPEMVTHLQVALRASERARKEGCKESSALRRYLAEVEVAAAGLVSRVHELEHLLTLSTASQENKDMDQLRGQILMVTARDARQHAIEAAQAISTARQATMQLDQVKREASSLTESQEEEIKRLSTEIQRCHNLLQKKDILLQEREKEEENLMHRCSALKGDLNASHLEVTSLMKQIEKVDDEKALCFQEMVHTLEFTKAAARATEHRLQEAQSQRKDTTIQNELLQHEVADLQSREVQTTIAHYDFELSKVRAVLEGEKTHLLAELAKLRQGNQSLKGEVAEWRGKYNKIMKITVFGEELVPTAFGTAEISSARLRKFLSTDSLDEGSYVLPEPLKGTPKKRTQLSGVAPMNQAANQSGREDTSDGQQLHLVRNSQEHQNAHLHARENIHEKANSRELNFQERNEGRTEPLIMSDRSESGPFCISKGTRSKAFDNQFYPLDSRNSDKAQICSTGNGEVEHDIFCMSGRPLGFGLQARNPVEGRENVLNSRGALDAKGMSKNAKKLRSVSLVDQLLCENEDGTLPVKDETCYEMGGNVLAVAHRELCKLKRINQQLVAACQ